MWTLLLLLLAPPSEPRGKEVPPAGDNNGRRAREVCVVAEPRALPPLKVHSGHREPEEGGQEHHQGKPSFSAARTIDLSLGVELRTRRSADKGVELRLYTPKGHLYQTLALNPPTATRPSHQVETAWMGTLPVAGTAIVNHSLYGRWRVEPHLAGRPEPCGDTVSLWLAP